MEWWGQLARLDPRTLVLVLCTLYFLTGESIHARYPIEAIMRRTPPEYRGLVKKALEELRRRGLVYMAGGKGKTYGLTRDGLERVREKCMEE